MKKQLSFIALSLSLVLGLSSCNNADVVPADGEQTSGKITVSFNLPQQTGTRATIAPSTAKPITSWASVTRAVILFVDASGMIKDARPVVLPTSGTSNTTDTYMGVVANANYDVYIVGNYPGSWNIGTMKGQSVNNFTIAAPVAAGYAAGPLATAGSFGYDEVGDIFVAKQSNIAVVADVNTTIATPFTLARINSLFRLRLDVETKKGTTLNDKIDFTTANSAMIAIRRAVTNYGLSGSTSFPVLTPTPGTATSPGTYTWANGTATTKEVNVFFKSGALLTSNPSSTTHTNNSTILAAGADYNLTMWNEYKIFPGGSNATGAGSSANKLDIIISGVTKDASYIPSGATVAVPAGTRVYWSGQIQKSVGPNQILELSVMLTSAGQTTVPPVGSYGNLEISADIVQWGDIIPSQMEL